MPSPTLAAIVAMTWSFGVFGLVAAWYLVPRFAGRDLGAAVTPLLWVHAFRYVALQLVVARDVGFAASDTAAASIVYGDLVGAALAVVALVAVRMRARVAVPLLWTFVAATVLDLANALRIGLAERLFETATAVSWTILTFYVPMLWISVGLVAWLLLSRGGAARETDREARP